MIKIKKQVCVDKYNKDYFENLYVSPDYSKDFNWNDFGDIYKELADLMELLPSNRVIDFGCGNGELSFCLYEKYQPFITGIDYSRDAIDIANNNLKKLIKFDSVVKLNFLNSNNSMLPAMENVSHIYFCDVLEHMYDDEISVIMDQIKKWNSDKNLKIIVHTDNDLFLRFVRPILDGMFVFLGFATNKDLKKRNDWENERHINLTNPAKLKKTMLKFGFFQIRLKYPEINIEKIGKQLGNAAKIPGLKKIVFYGLNTVRFLSPSFYAVYEYGKKK